MKIEDYLPGCHRVGQGSCQSGTDSAHIDCACPPPGCILVHNLMHSMHSMHCMHCMHCMHFMHPACGMKMTYSNPGPIITARSVVRGGQEDH